jgi:hypothetical protein
MAGEFSSQEQEIFTVTKVECEFCRYPAKDLLDLGEHVYQCHGPDDETEEDPIVCYICGWKVDSKGDLMKHRKEKHIQHVRICLYFEKGNCDFDAEDCWYQHKSALPQTIKEFKCSLCGDISKTKPDLMKHRKIEHTDYFKVKMERFTLEKQSLGRVLSVIYFEYFIYSSSDCAITMITCQHITISVPK